MEIRTLLIPIGEHPHPEGVQVIDAAAIQRIAAAARRHGRDLPVDHDHATAADPAAPLAGHIAPRTLEPRSDGLYGTITLNARGMHSVARGGYRYLSPALLHNPRYAANGRLHMERLLAVALTNDPNMPLPPLTTKP